jgi:predicted amidohydrolase
MTSLRVASVQFELRAEESFDAFAAHLTSVVERAAAEGGELVVLPELVTTGLLASHPGAASLGSADVAEAYRAVFPPLTAPFEELAGSLATRTGVTILAGSHLRRDADGSFRNTAVLAHPDGRIEHQDKLHLTPQEQGMGLTPGDDVVVTTIGPARVAVQICADIEFPEVNRLLALRGVELVLCPSLTWNTRGAYRVRYGAHARAMENQLYVVTAPLVGSSGLPTGRAIHGTGYAVVTGPIDRRSGLDDGVVAAHPDTRGEGMVVADLDFDVIADSRADPEPPGLSNIRPDLYDRFAATVEQPVP